MTANVEPWRTFEGEAVFSDDGRYRYRLDRVFAEPYGDRHIAWIMLNPSTADADTNDPTVARVVKRSHGYGARRVTVLNLYGLRSTDPKALRAADDPVGPGNDYAVIEAAHDADLVIAAWGVAYAPAQRSGEVLADVLNEAGIDLYALALTKGGVPRHPLYVGYDAQPFLWRPATGPCVECGGLADEGGHATACCRRWPR